MASRYGERLRCRRPSGPPHPISGDATPVHHLELHLVGPSGTDFGYCDTDYATLPNRLGWNLVEVPLKALRNGCSGESLTPAGLGGRLDGFTIGFESTTYRDMYFSDIAIRY
jgi:hypothetical protein